MLEPFEVYEHAGLSVELHYDPDPMSPDDWDTLGTFTQWHRRYSFGAPVEGAELEALERGGPRLLARYLELVEHAAGVVPVGLLDHSGLHVYAGGGPARSDSAGWDSGTVGFMWTTHERLNELCGEAPEYHTREWIEQALAGEVRTWDDYLGGRVVGYVVRDPETGDEVGACWGFYPDEGTRDDVHGLRYVRAEAEAEAEAEADERTRAASAGIATAGRNA